MSWGVTSHDIYLASTDGKVLRRLSPENNTTIHGISDWSEDGRIIFTEWNKEDMFVGPVMVNADGSGYHRLEQARGGTHARWIPITFWYSKDNLHNSRKLQEIGIR